MQKCDFLKKLSNLDGVYWDRQEVVHGLFKEPIKIQDGWDPPSWKSTWRHFLCWGWSDLDKISHSSAEWHVDCSDMVKIETRCRIPIWRTFGRISWHVIPELPATLQGVLPPREFNVMIPELCVTLQRAATERIQRNVILEPCITLQGAAAWWIHSRDSRATCHIAECSHLA